jgi:hypothetical protein
MLSPMIAAAEGHQEDQRRRQPVGVPGVGPAMIGAV